MDNFRERILELNPDAIVFDGLDSSIIGIGERVGMNSVAVYSVEKIVRTFVERDKMSYEEAYDMYEFNYFNAWLGEYTPIFVTTNL
jgi:hypothetical protein